MSLESLVSTYGYVAILLGTFLEGETILVVGGFAAHRGYLKLPWVILAAFLGTLSSDQLFFFLGRRHATYILAKRPTWRERIEKVNALWERYSTLYILAFRFLYGLRTVSPFVIGTSSVPTRRFVALNVVGALVWASTVATGGYLFGVALESLIEDIKRYELEAIALIAAVGGAIWLVHFLRKRRTRRPSP